MTVELLWWEGCPSHPEALAELERILREEGVEADGRAWRSRTTSRRAASASRLAHDPRRRGGHRPPGEDEPFSLTCRVYRTRDGRMSPLPDPEDLREAVRSRAR